MAKQGQILVIGCTERAEALIRDSQGDRYRFTCCAGDNHTGTSTGQTGRHYDWIVINGEALGGDETELIRSLRAMGFFSRTGGQRCGVEWLPDGTLELHCCAQASMRGLRALTGQYLESGIGDLVFEYHAPVKRTG